MNLKIFKKLRLFDVFLILIFVTLASSAYFLLFRAKKDLIVVVKTSEENVAVWPWEKTKLWNSTIWFNNLFHSGMKEKDALGKPAAEVISVRKYDNRPDNPTTYLTLKIKTVFSPGSKVYTYKGKNVLIGSTIQLFLDQVFVEGLIVNIEGAKDLYPVKKLAVTARLINYDPIFPDTNGVETFIADSLTVGSSVKDSSGKIILKIVDKKVEDANQVVKTASGNVLLRKNPLKKDVYLNLEIMAYKLEGRYYFFDNIPVLIGGEIPVHLDNISVFPTITSIEEAK